MRLLSFEVDDIFIETCPKFILNNSNSNNQMMSHLVAEMPYISMIKKQIEVFLNFHIFLQIRQFERRNLIKM